MEKRIRELLNQGLLHSEVSSAIYKEYAGLNLREADRFKIACMVRDIDPRDNRPVFSSPAPNWTDFEKLSTT